MSTIITRISTPFFYLYSVPPSHILAGSECSARASVVSILNSKGMQAFIGEDKSGMSCRKTCR